MNGENAGQPTIPVFGSAEAAEFDDLDALTAVYLYLKDNEAGSRNPGTLFKSTIIVVPCSKELPLVGVFDTK
jgi:hypothetical protein